jgi:D-alanine-D-alanine ligase
MMHVGLLYSQSEIDKEMEFEINPHGAIQMDVTVNAIETALQEKGHRVTLIPAGLDLLQRLSAMHDLDIIFNVSTGITKKSQQAHVVAMLEMMDIPFVGSGLSAHILGLHKQITKRLFITEGIPTPRFQVFYTGDEPFDAALRFPLIIKPEHEGSSIGITKDSVVHDEAALRKQVKQLIQNYQQAALVEEFIKGREFTMGILGNHDPELFPIEEIIFDHRDTENLGAMTLDIKTRDAIIPKAPADLDETIAEKMRDYAVKAFRVLGCRDFARLDIRLDESGTPYFLEVNTLPGMQPDYSEFPRMSVAAGYSYPDLVEKLIKTALQRSTG